MKYDNVYTVDEENSHRFYQLPKELFVNEKYKRLNSDAKLLYALLLDRKELSRSNNWVDEYGQVFLIYTRNNIMDMLNLSTKTTTKAFKQLNECGLIIEVRQGLNKPNKIYICKVEYGDNKGDVLSTSQDGNNLHTNDTELSNTEKNNKGSTKVVDRISSFNTFKSQNHIDIETAESIEYYMGRYNDYMGKEHPRLKKHQWDYVANDLLNVVDDDIGADFDLDGESLKDMIDKHFVTTYQDGCDYNILHFMNDAIRVRRMYEVAY